MRSLAAFAPPTYMAQGSELPLGAPVRWTHRAAVIRFYGNAGWRLVEGMAHQHEEPRINEPRLPDDHPFDDLFGPRDPFYDRAPGPFDPNKSIVVWPDVGAGVLVGLIRRSERPSGGHGGMFDDSYDPGGFTADAFVPLYAVKCELGGIACLYAPHWAVSVGT